MSRFKSSFGRKEIVRKGTRKKICAPIVFVCIYEATLRTGKTAGIGVESRDPSPGFFYIIRSGDRKIGMFSVLRWIVVTPLQPTENICTQRSWIISGEVIDVIDPTHLGSTMENQQISYFFRFQ